ncbi:persulfide dioxygenase ETHE1, mitochondrial [Euwallacea fornicatus]|uniref:persulfide dioxygenase ETHE1, mitochondrial n=1 Tax=Euwallacea fornicatus TaxID=995702 RepID=UPI00338F31E4
MGKLHRFLCTISNFSTFNHQTQRILHHHYPTTNVFHRRHFNSYNTSKLVFRQLFDHTSSTYTYLLGCPDTKQCILIDPVVEQVKRDFQVTQDLRLKLIYAINTHMHADHVTGTGYLRVLSGCKTIISKNSGADADIWVKDNDEIVFGNIKLTVLSTPGHTNGCVTYYSKEQGIAFTGDAVLIRGCGRTDFQEGNPRTLYRSVHRKVFTLPETTVLYPAHDYQGMTSTTVDEEKRLNPRLTKTEDQFVDIMNNLNLEYPTQIDRALPANRVCGVHDIPKAA